MCPAFPQTAEVDPNEVRTFELIPAGWYAAQMVDSKHEAAKSGNGEYLKLEFDLLDAPYANRKIWLNLNLWHANEEAVRIANQQRLELLQALGKPNAQTTEELHAIPVMIKVGIREDKSGKYEPQNIIKGFKAYGSATPARAAGFSGATRPAAAAPVADTRKPWQK